MSEATKLAVIIATKNRAEAMERYALGSLQRSDFRDFICVVWDASDDDSTRKIIEGGKWNFPLEYFKAPRTGLPSQRNDAVAHVMKHHKSVRYVLFIDDDSELLENAIEGLLLTFEDESVWGVHIPQVFQKTDGRSVLAGCGKIGMGLRNQFFISEHVFGKPAEWLSGCSMAFRMEVFSELQLCFPEAFQRFGGYALGEDVAISYYLYRKIGKKLINSKKGTLRHHLISGGRPNVLNLTASKWYNFHLLFQAVYDDVSGLKKLWLKAELKFFLIGYVIKAWLRQMSWGVWNFAPFAGMFAGRRALRDFFETQDIKTLLTRPRTDGK